MTTFAAPTFEPNPLESRALSRAVRWSFGVHAVAIVALVIIPGAWLQKAPPRKLMTITLGGTPGPRSTGTTSMGGRTIEQVAPPPKRAEPIRPTPKAEAVPAPPAKTTPPPSSRPVQAAKAAVPPQRPATTGRQVTQGNTPVDTGAVGQGAGLTFGGGSGGGETDLKDFCCPEYLNFLRDRIDANWAKNQPARGVTVMRFTIRRDGTISDVAVEEPSGVGMLDRASRSAVQGITLTPLPAAYPSDTLTIHLKFPYEGS